MGQLRYNLLFRWFVGLSLDDEIWDETVFTKMRVPVERDHGFRWKMITQSGGT
jgi:transposase